MRLPWRGRPVSPFVGPCVLVPLLLLVAGCGTREGTVSGQVIYQGKPVPGGHVIFRPADPRRNTEMADIDPTGHYQATLPVGEVRVAVDNRDLEPVKEDRSAIPQPPPGIKLPPLPRSATQPLPQPSPNAPQKPAGTYVPLPDRFHDVATSGVKITVTGGSQSLNIELK